MFRCFAPKLFQCFDSAGFLYFASILFWTLYKADPVKRLALFWCCTSTLFHSHTISVFRSAVLQCCETDISLGSFSLGTMIMSKGTRMGRHGGKLPNWGGRSHISTLVLTGRLLHPGHLLSRLQLIVLLLPLRLLLYVCCIVVSVSLGGFQCFARRFFTVFPLAVFESFAQSFKILTLNQIPHHLFRIILRLYS